MSTRCVNCGYKMYYRYSRDDMLKRGKKRKCARCGEDYDVVKQEILEMVPDNPLAYFMGDKKEAEK